MSMLVLSRKPGQVIDIGDEVSVTVVRIGPNNVRIGIDAPRHLKVVRREIKDDDLASRKSKQIIREND